MTHNWWKVRKFLFIQSGSIITTGPLDRESQDRYSLTVIATDGIQSGSCQVRINLLDVNDNPPQFTQLFYSIDVNEDTALGTTIGGVQAHDPDTEENGEVTYFMTSAWANDTFYLDPVMGTFVLRSVIDFEQVGVCVCLRFSTISSAEQAQSLCAELSDLDLRVTAQRQQDMLYF